MDAHGGQPDHQAEGQRSRIAALYDRLVRLVGKLPSDRQQALHEHLENEANATENPDADGPATQSNPG